MSFNNLWSQKAFGDELERVVWNQQPPTPRHRLYRLGQMYLAMSRMGVRDLQ